jgi:preprotein translocase subunit SecG
MSTLVTFLHIIVCLILVGSVLLQQGKGGGMGGAFGGGNASTVFGSGGASVFLRRLTAIAATVFMMTSMVLAYIASNDAGDALRKFSEQQTSLKKRKTEAEQRALEGAGIGTGDLEAPDDDGALVDEPDPEPSGADVNDGDTGEDHAPTPTAPGAEVPTEVRQPDSPPTGP